MAAQYFYSFVPWPDETWDFDRAVYCLFDMLKRRVEMRFTTEEFERFRSALFRHGITLREIGRRPYHPVESVD